MNKDYKHLSDNRLVAFEIEIECLKQLEMLNEKMGFYFKNLKDAQKRIKEADEALFDLESNG